MRRMTDCRPPASVARAQTGRRLLRVVDAQTCGEVGLVDDPLPPQLRQRLVEAAHRRRHLQQQVPHGGQEAAAARQCQAAHRQGTYTRLWACTRGHRLPNAAPCRRGSASRRAASAPCAAWPSPSSRWPRPPGSSRPPRTPPSPPADAAPPRTPARLHGPQQHKCFSQRPLMFVSRHGRYI